jgi:hypothetical protein
MRQIAAVLLLCALFEVLLMAGPPLEAHAQGYDVSGQAVVDPLSIIGTSSQEELEGHPLRLASSSSRSAW